MTRGQQRRVSNRHGAWATSCDDRGDIWREAGRRLGVGRGAASILVASRQYRTATGDGCPAIDEHNRARTDLIRAVAVLCRRTIRRPGSAGPRRGRLEWPTDTVNGTTSDVRQSCHSLIKRVQCVVAVASRHVEGA